MVGLGRTGVAASGWLADHGVRVYASDADQRPELSDVAEELRAKSVVVDVGLHDLQRIRECAAVVVSPGVPPTAPPIAAAHAAGVEVVSELDLAARILSDSKMIVVTGTNGKTTTTALIAHLLRAAGKSAKATRVDAMFVAFESLIHKTPSTSRTSSNRCASGEKDSIAEPSGATSTSVAATTSSAASAFSTLWSPNNRSALRSTTSW